MSSKSVDSDRTFSVAMLVITILIAIAGGALADELDEDPLHGFLVGLRMLSEMMADLPAGHPGCLVSSQALDCRA